MKKGAWIGIIVLVVLIIVGFIVLTGNKGKGADISQSPSSNEPIKCNDPPCLGRYFQTCTPAGLTMDSGGQNAVITIHGLENEKCHFSMVMNGIKAADCYFNKADLNDKVLNQMFGNKEGQDAVIAAACGTS